MKKKELKKKKKLQLHRETLNNTSVTGGKDTWAASVCPQAGGCTWLCTGTGAC